MKIGLFGSDYQEDKLCILKRIFDKLQELKASVFVDHSYYKYLTETLHYAPQIEGILTSDQFDLDVALSIGGDGTFLHTAARINKQNIPIVGINTGHLGFLAGINSNELEKELEELFAGKMVIEERTLIQLSTKEHAYKEYNYALNEIAILKRDTSSMITVHTALDDDYLASYQADGLVVATPTGSTAYSMSVGGPIIVPHSKSLVLSPVAPHSLNMRPLVIPDTMTISLEVESRNQYFLVSLDGRAEVFDVGIKLEIKKADFTTKILKRTDNSFYQTLREKLMWGTDPRVNEAQNTCSTT